MNYQPGDVVKVQPKGTTSIFEVEIIELGKVILVFCPKNIGLPIGQYIRHYSSCVLRQHNIYAYWLDEIVGKV